MKQPPTSHDPHFLNWSRRRNEQINLFNNCFSYACGNAKTINEFQDRDHPAIRQPDVGDSIGMPIKIHSLAHGFNAGVVCKLAELMGMTRVHVEPYDRLPTPPEGQRLVFMWFLPGTRESNSMYHWGKIDPVDPERPHAPRVCTNKMADEPPSMLDSKGHVIVDPRYANFRQNQEGPFFFFIPQEGLDLSMHPAWVEPIKQAYDHQKKLVLGKPVPELGEAFSTIAALIKPGTDPKLESFVKATVAKNTATAVLG